jgi:hypothetical protein
MPRSEVPVSQSGTACMSTWQHGSAMRVRKAHMCGWVVALAPARLLLHTIILQLNRMRRSLLVQTADLGEGPSAYAASGRRTMRA